MYINVHNHDPAFHLVHRDSASHHLLSVSRLLLAARWYKNFKQTANQSVNEMNKKLVATPQTPSRAVVGDANGRHTGVRASDTRKQIEASEGNLQTRLSNSYLGTFVFGCVVIASLALNASHRHYRRLLRPPPSLMRQRTTPSCSSSCGSSCRSGLWLSKR